MKSLNASNTAVLSCLGHARCRQSGQTQFVRDS